MHDFTWSGPKQLDFSAWFYMWNYTSKNSCKMSKLNPNTLFLRWIDYIIAGKNFFLWICSASQLSILCHLQNLKPRQHVYLTPANLHAFVCSTCTFCCLVLPSWELGLWLAWFSLSVALAFGAQAFAVLVFSFNLGFCSSVFGC